MAGEGLPVLEPMLELDILVGLMTLATVIHAATTRGGITLAVVVLVLALMVEQASVWLGGTHCHKDASAMVTPCSSVNSVVYYVRPAPPNPLIT